MGGRGALSGNRGGFGSAEAGNVKTPTKLYPLSSIKDKKVYSSLKEAISRYESTMGVRQREVKLGKLGNGVGGVHVSSGGQSEVIVLNKSVYNSKKSNYKTLSSWASRGYDSGHITRTNKPVSHIVTHELAHATWNSHLSGKQHKAAAPHIDRVYKSFLKDKKKSGYGRYAHTNVNEFYAEVSTKAIHGKADKYTRKIKTINKKYGL